MLYFFFGSAKGMVDYGMSKTAFNSAVITMVKELLGRNIRVNAVALAFVDTSMVDKVAELIEA